MYIKRKKIKAVIGFLKAGQNLDYSIQKAGIKGRATWYRWEANSPRLANLRRRAEEVSCSLRDSMVEDSLLNACTVKKNVLAMIFYLTNRMPDRWKDKRAVATQTNITKVEQTNVAERDFNNEHDRQIAGEMLGWIQKQIGTNPG